MRSGNKQPASRRKGDGGLSTWKGAVKKQILISSQLLFTLLSFGSGFKVQGSRFRVQGSGFRVQGSGFKVQGSGFRVQGLRFKVQGLRFKVQGLGGGFAAFF